MTTERAGVIESAGMPGGFHRAAAEIYRRIGRLKDADSPIALETILDALTK